jgi:FAD synthetase
MTTVLVFGTFDKLHPGHEWFLMEAKKYGDRLVVVVGRDRNVTMLKGRQPKQSEADRLAAIQRLPYVTEARLGLENYTRRLEMIASIKPAVICLGYDQAPNFRSPSPNIRVTRLPAFYPEKYKSSLL